MAEAGLHPEAGGSPRRPLVGLALAGALGAASGLASPCPAIGWAVAGVVLLLAGGLIRRNGLANLLLQAATWATFACAGALQQPAARPLSLNRILPALPVQAEVVGVVDGEPVLSSDASGKPQWRFELAVAGVRVRGGWQTVDDVLSVTWSEAEAGVTPALGDQWRVRGLIREPRAGARSRRLIQRATGSEATVLARATAFPVRRWCERGRAWCASVLGRGLGDFPLEAGMLRALILGYRQELPPELLQAFSRTGTLHVIAVSGSHVAIFAGIVVALLKAGGLPRTRWIIVLAPALLLYCMSTGLAPSAIRACIMALVFWSATLFDRRPDGPTALGLSALLILFVAPGQVRDAGFVLSFVAVAGLMIFYPPLRKAFTPRRAEEPDALPATRWQMAGRAAARATWQLLAASIAAWLVTTPLTMEYFNLLSPSGLALNLVVIPLAGVILFAGTLSLFAAPFSSFLVEVINHASRVLVTVMVRLVDWVDRCPGSHYFVLSPPAWFLLAWAGALVALFFGGPRVRRLTLAGLVAAGAWAGRAHLNDRTVRGVVWSRDDTLVQFLDLPGQKDVLMDTGRPFRARELVQHLRAEGVDRLGVVVLTRARSDAAGGLELLLREIPVGEVWCAEGGQRSSVFTAALAEAGQRGIPVRRLRVGESGEWSGRLQWTVLPGPENSLSLHLARGPASLRWDGAGGGPADGPAVGLWVSADGQRAAVPSGCLLTPALDPLTADTPRARNLSDGDRARWVMADERKWRFPEPAIRLQTPMCPE